MPASAHSVARKRWRMRASAPTIHGPVNRYEKKQKEKALKPGKFRDVPDRTRAGCLRSQTWLVPGPPQAQSVLFLFFTCSGQVTRTCVRSAPERLADTVGHVGAGIPPALNVIVEPQIGNPLPSAIIANLVNLVALCKQLHDQFGSVPL